MTKLQDELSRAAIACGLEINLDVPLRLPSGRTVVALAHIEGLGAKNGMIIVTSFGAVEELVDELTDNDYGFSVMQEPTLKESYDLDGYIEVFNDWGWFDGGRKHLCRVCGLFQDDPPWGADGKTATFNICDCCGVEFGYQDATPEATNRFREKWISEGAEWSDAKARPAGWSLSAQLALIGIPAPK